VSAAGKGFLLAAAGLHFVIAGWRFNVTEKELWNQKTADDACSSVTLFAIELSYAVPFSYLRLCTL